ncbi:MAG: hypothetical protein AAFO06_26160, partial [Cyanobacteria bacterium J06597_16]
YFSFEAMSHSTKRQLLATRPSSDVDWCKIGAIKVSASEFIDVKRFQNLEDIVDINEVRRSSRRTSIL